MASHQFRPPPRAGPFQPRLRVVGHRGQRRAAGRQDLSGHRRLRWPRRLVRPPGLACRRAAASPPSPAAATAPRPSPCRPPETAAPRRRPTPSVSSASRRPSPSPSRSRSRVAVSRPARRRSAHDATAAQLSDRQPPDGPRRTPACTAPAAGRRPGHRGPVRRPDVLLRRHQPVDRLRLLRLHASTSSARSASACRAPPTPSAQPPPVCRTRSRVTSCSSAARPTTWASTPETA